MPCYSRLLPADAPASILLDDVKKAFVDCHYEIDPTILDKLFETFRVESIESVRWVVKTALILYFMGAYDQLSRRFLGFAEEADRFFNPEQETELRLIGTSTGRAAPGLPVRELVVKAAIRMFILNYCTNVGWQAYDYFARDMRKMWDTATHQMVFYTFINRSRFNFSRTEESCYKGEFNGMFEFLDMAVRTSEGDLVAYGHISSTSGSVSGAASAVTFTAYSGVCDKGERFQKFYFVVAGASPIKGKNTLEVRINESNAKELADHNDTSGNGQESFEQSVQLGRNAPINIRARVEPGLWYCHVIVQIDGSQIMA